MMHNIIHPESEHLFSTLIYKENIRSFLDSLQNHHRETYEHSLRVSLLSIDLGYDNELNRVSLEWLGYAGLLHDVEKVKTPLELLSKNVSLDTVEKITIKEHPRLGFNRLQHFAFEIVREIVVAHHEYKKNPYPRSGVDRRRIDRAGPDRRKNKVNVITLAQIVAIADMYDALTNKRSYKAPLTKAKTEEILRYQFTGDHRYITQVLSRYTL